MTSVLKGHLLFGVSLHFSKSSKKRSLAKEAKVALKPKPEPSEEPEKRRMKALFSRWFFGGWNDLFIEFLQKTPWGPHDFPMNGH